jgi:HD-GYP domain-containing protein (c-di-GMP phosphodiesterase class II)
MKRITGDSPRLDAVYPRHAELVAQQTMLRNGLMAALEARDCDTEKHSHAVVSLALKVGVRMELSMEELRELESVAMLHDIGKLGIPDAILLHGGDLDDEQWAVMRKHVVYGAEMVALLPPLAQLAAGIRASHERWDGCGYPDALAGEEIPLSSRIVSVCDAYHAMTSDRPYRKAMGERRAVEELACHAGDQFCPKVVAATLLVLSEQAERAPVRRSTR